MNKICWLLVVQLFVYCESLGFMLESPLVISISGESINQNDNTTYYLCEEGETVDVTCSNSYNYGSLRLKYHDGYGKQLVETDEASINLLYFHLTVRSESNQSYVDCEHLSEGHKVEYTYRIIFIVAYKPFRQNPFIITVNGVKLIPKSIKNALDNYNYKFIYGEPVIVTCEKRNQSIKFPIHQLAKSSDRELRIVTQIIEFTQSLFQFQVESKYLHNSSIECFMKEPDGTNYWTANIYFEINRYGDPGIQGLSTSDVLYQYNMNYKTWVAHYQYTPNTTLPLTCVTSNNTKLYWFHGDKLVPVSQNSKVTEDIINLKYISETFTLNQNIITCSNEEGSRTKLIFHQTNKNGSETPMFLIIGCVGAVLMVTVSVIYIVYYVCSKHTNAITKREIPAMFPGPRESNEYTYIENEYHYIEDRASVSNSLYNKSLQNYGYSNK